MTSLHWQTSLQTQICHAHCMPGKTDTRVDTALCLGDDYSLREGLTFGQRISIFMGEASLIIEFF